MHFAYTHVWSTYITLLFTAQPSCESILQCFTNPENNCIADLQASGSVCPPPKKGIKSTLMLWPMATKQFGLN